MTPAGAEAAAAIKFAISSGSSVCHALALSGHQVIEATPSLGGQSHITFWSPSQQLITLRLSIAGWDHTGLTIEEI